MHATALPPASADLTLAVKELKQNHSCITFSDLVTLGGAVATEAAGGRLGQGRAALRSAVPCRTALRCAVQCCTEGRCAALFR